MQLTGKQIAQEGIITNFIDEAVQQQGIDLRLMEVRRFGRSVSCPYKTFAFDGEGKPIEHESHIIINHTNSGYIPEHGKTHLPDSVVVEPMAIQIDPNNSEVRRMGWYLQPGYYEVIFDEGCRMPKNRVMVFISRSSLVRCGAQIVCGQFDAGFETEHMGCFLRVDQPIYIERHARIAQTRIFETADVDNMYDGQWQGDKQRAGQNQ